MRPPQISRARARSIRWSLSPVLLKQLFALGKNLVLAFWTKTILISSELKIMHFLVLNLLSYLFELFN